MKSSRVPALFAGIAVVFGTALVFLTPPIQVADEYWHFFRAYQISLGQLTAETRGNAQGGLLPVSLLEVCRPFADLPYHPDRKTSRQRMDAAAAVQLDPTRTTFCYFSNAANYCPLDYAPQALAIAIGRTLGFRPLVLLYLGREATLLAWTLLGYFTLKLAGAIARPVLLVLLMPMSIAWAASVSADAMTNAICLLFTAAIWHYGVEGNPILSPISVFNKTAIFALSIAVTLCKFAYLPLILLVLLIKPSRFGGRRRYFKFVAVLFIVNVLVSLAWLRTTAGTSLVLRPDRPDVNVARQLNFLEQHPLSFFPALARGLATDGTFILRSFIGNLGWSDNPASPAVVWIYWLALILACWPLNSDPPSPAKWRLAVAAASICASTLVFSLFNYLAWTPVGSQRLEGLQGRYFIPLAAALLICIWGAMRRAPVIFRPLPARGDAAERLNLSAGAFCICACFYTLFLVYRRYYLIGY